MTALNTTPGGSANINLTANQGADLNFALTGAINDAAVNLTGYTADMQIRRGADGPAVLTLNETDGITLGGSAGTITVSVPAADMVMPPAPYVYDLELVSGGGVVRRLVRGTFTVIREVTRA